MSGTVPTTFGMTFASMEELEAWEAGLDASIEAARQTPLLTEEEADTFFDALLADLAKRVMAQAQAEADEIPHPVA